MSDITREALEARLGVCTDRPNGCDDCPSREPLCWNTDPMEGEILAAYALTLTDENADLRARIEVLINRPVRCPACGEMAVALDLMDAIADAVKPYKARIEKLDDSQCHVCGYKSNAEHYQARIEAALAVLDDYHTISEEPDTVEQAAAILRGEK